MIRLDDRHSGSSWQFDDPTATMRATSIGDVRSTVSAAEQRATTHGEWVVMVVAYEAAAAFDPALRTAPAPPPGIPFVWWQSFRERADGDPLPAPDTRPASDVRRRPNLHPFPTAVSIVRAQIERGDVYQANVSDRFEGRLTGSPIDFYAGLLAAQRCAFGAYIEMEERIVASASPELFFDRRDGRITCRPMKGTAARRPRPLDDMAAGAALLASQKDRAENVMIVDLLRNDLGRLARTGSVEVPDLFRLERYETVWQLTSTVTAEVAGDPSLVEVLSALFPCGSVTGAPKVAAMRTINDLEAEPRGVYCGAIGLLTPAPSSPRAVFSVPIRTAVIDPACRAFDYAAGAGITWSSDPVEEDREVEAKARILHVVRPPTGLFETLRLDDDGVRNAELHVERLSESAAWFGIPIDPAAALQLLATMTPTAGVVERIRLLLDAEGRLSLTRQPLEPDRCDVVRLAVDDTVTHSDDPRCCHKTTDRAHYDRARARHPHADDVILVNEVGHVIETTIANLAVRVDGRWWCPPLGDGGLPGVARRVAVASGELGERSFTPDEVRAADGLAVLNDLRGWRPATLAETPTAPSALGRN